MEDSVTRWYVERDDNGEPVNLARIRQEVDGLYAEIWNGRDWEYWPPAIRFLHDPLAGDEVDEAEANAAARALASPTSGG
jgi:hypothetical protein